MIQAQKTIIFALLCGSFTGNSLIADPAIQNRRIARISAVSSSALTLNLVRKALTGKLSGKAGSYGLWFEVGAALATGGLAYFYSLDQKPVTEDSSQQDKKQGDASSEKKAPAIATVAAPAKRAASSSPTEPQQESKRRSATDAERWETLIATCDAFNNDPSDATNEAFKAAYNAVAQIPSEQIPAKAQDALNQADAQYKDADKYQNENEDE